MDLKNLVFYTYFLHRNPNLEIKRESMSSETKWERTQVQALLRNGSSGIYYGRWKLGGKQKWKSLKTSVFSIAKLRLIDEAAMVERLRGAARSVSDAAPTIGELIDLYRKQTQLRTDIKLSSKASRMTALGKITKTWPGLARMKPAQVSAAKVAEWARHFKVEGTKFKPPGSKTSCLGNSATSVNRAIDTLRAIMELAVVRGVIASNPVRTRTADGERLKKKVTKAQLDLPSTSDLHRMLAAIENNGARGGWGKEAADFCRFLGYSGCRVAEAGMVTWAHVDWQKGQIRVPGQKSETSNRIVPLFADLEKLLQAVIERRKAAARFTVDGKPDLDPGNLIFRISECQKSIDAACAKTRIKRVTHHDFRHLFATVCIESGVDIPTVSRWLGHSDGGALAMRTYGHLRQEHSQTQAAKVIFGVNYED